MSKATIQTLIDALGTGQLNTALEVRTALNGLLNEDYSAPVKEQSAGTHANTGTVTGVFYDLIFKKTGNQVRIVGTIKNNNADSLSGTNLLTITTSEYQCRTGFDVLVEDKSGIKVKFSAGDIKLVNVLVGGAGIFIDTTYFTND